MHISSVQRLAGTSKRLARLVSSAPAFMGSWKGWRRALHHVFTATQAHLITVGVISAQKKMLSVLTAWEENMPMMEKATENFLFRVSRRTGREGKHVRSPEKHSKKIPSTVHTVYLCHAEGCTSQSLHSVGRGRGGEFSWAGTRRGQDALTKQAEY